MVIYAEYFNPTVSEPKFYVEPESDEEDEHIEAHFAVEDLVTIPGLTADNADYGKPFQVVGRFCVPFTAEENDEVEIENGANGIVTAIDLSDCESEDGGHSEGAEPEDYGCGDIYPEKEGWYYRLDREPGQDATNAADFSWWREDRLQLDTKSMDMAGGSEDEGDTTLDTDERQNLRHNLTAGSSQGGFIESAGVLFID